MAGTTHLYWAIIRIASVRVLSQEERPIMPMTIHTHRLVYYGEKRLELVPTTRSKIFIRGLYALIIFWSIGFAVNSQYAWIALLAGPIMLGVVNLMSRSLKTFAFDRELNLFWIVQDRGSHFPLTRIQAVEANSSYR